MNGSDHRTASGDCALHGSEKLLLSIITDRYDRCGALAYLLVVFAGDLELTFSGLRGRRYSSTAHAALVVHGEDCRLGAGGESTAHAARDVKVGQHT